MYKLIVILLLFLLGFYFIYRSNDIEALTPSHSAGNNSDEEYKVAENCPYVGGVCQPECVSSLWRFAKCNLG